MALTAGKTELLKTRFQFTGLSYPPHSRMREQLPSPPYTGVYDIFPFKKSQKKDLAMKEAIGENGYVPALENAVFQADKILTGLISTNFGLPHGEMYTVQMQGFDKVEADDLAIGSSVGYKLGHKKHTLSVVKDTDEELYIMHEANGHKGIKKVIAHIIKDKKGQIEMVQDMNLSEEPHLKKAAAALALVQQLSILDLEVRQSGKKHEGMWVVVANTNKYKQYQEETDKQFLTFQASRPLVD